VGRCPCPASREGCGHGELSCVRRPQGRTGDWRSSRGVGGWLGPVEKGSGGRLDGGISGQGGMVRHELSNGGMTH
jgi:hypothetical protein